MMYNEEDEIQQELNSLPNSFEEENILNNPVMPGNQDQLMVDDFEDQTIQAASPSVEAPATTEESVKDRYLKMLDNQKQQDSDGYKEASSGGNKMQLYGNLLSGFQNMIQNSVSRVAPNFKADMSVADNLRNQGKDLVSEFYKVRQNERAQQDQVGSNLSKEMALDSSDLDLKEKKLSFDPNSPMVGAYKKFILSRNKSLSIDDLNNMSPARLLELAKTSATLNQADQDQALGWARLAQTKEENKLGRDLKQDLQKEKLEEIAKEKAKLSDKQSADITNLDQALDQMGIIGIEKEKIDTGPLAATQSGLAQFFGVDDSEVSGFKARVGSQLADYIKSISGAAVSDQERAFLLQNMPSMKDNDQTFQTKLNIVKNRLKRNRDIYLNNLKAKGKNVESTTQTGDYVPDMEPTKSAPGGQDIVERNNKKYKWNPSVGKYQPIQ